MKKPMSKEVIKEHYKPLLNSYGDRLSVKTKINTGGPRVCRCWDEDKNPRDLPENWLSIRVRRQSKSTSNVDHGIRFWMELRVYRPTGEA